MLLSVPLVFPYNNSTFSQDAFFIQIVYWLCYDTPDISLTDNIIRPFVSLMTPFSLQVNITNTYLLFIDWCLINQ